MGWKPYRFVDTETLPFRGFPLKLGFQLELLRKNDQECEAPNAYSSLGDGLTVQTGDKVASGSFSGAKSSLER